VLLLDLHPVDVVISLINIAVLFILLRLILWKHVIRFLAGREERIKNDLEQAEQRCLDAEALHSEYSEQLEKIEERGREMIRESRLKAGEEADRILMETEGKTSEMIRDAQARIDMEKEQAYKNAQLEVSVLATDMAARILKREVSAKDSANAVDEFFRDT
jgi:F-type H+-transporting ATPase subunit b